MFNTSYRPTTIDFYCLIHHSRDTFQLLSFSDVRTITLSLSSSRFNIVTNTRDILPGFSPCAIMIILLNYYTELH